MDEIEELLTPQEVADRLKVTLRTVNDMRLRPGGPPFVRVGHKTIRYRESDVARWLAAQ